MKLLPILAAFTAAVLTPGALQAQTVSPLPAPTIIKTAPFTISAAGYYQLGADLTVPNITGNIITIAASNVTLDFGGHYISGPVNASSTLVGVYANEEGNLKIQNGTIAYCYQGIYLKGNGTATSININQQISTMLVSYCYNTGIYLGNANYSACTNNRISFITASQGLGCGIYDYSSAGNQASDNIITNVTASGSGGTAAGIYSESGNLTASHNTVSNIINSVTSSQAIGIYSPVFGVGNTVRNCYFGIVGGKLQNNLSSGCTTAFAEYTDAGEND